MSPFVTLWRREPAVMTALVAGVIDAAIILAVAFGLPLTVEQRSALEGLLSAGLALVGLVVTGVVVRGQVTPITAGLIPRKED